ncbi:MAG TPA: hypothetical protein VFT29_14795 [Gemmatimonadaceae bacterium]|nr:hypothetical protein [Gemmatimonadaceae bacterium]
MTFEEDEETATKYQWPMRSDTMDVCETWVGNDYRWAMQTVGTSDRASGVYDMARDGVYDSGTLYVAEQGSVVQSQPAGSTLFNTFSADPAQIQASYDDPYCGIVSQENCSGVSCEMFSVGSSLSAVRAEQSPDTSFRRHGLARRGVRALVQSMDEAGLSPEGYRRFRSSGPSGERTLLVHPTIQLLMGEDFRDDSTEIAARHEWTPTSRGYVRTRTVIELRSRGAGRRLLGRTTLMVTDVRLDGQLIFAGRADQ